VAVLRTASVRRNGLTWTGNVVDVMAVRDGEVTEFWDYATDGYELDKVLGS
jgi:ketosteroid isomerase-like protein